MPIVLPPVPMPELTQRSIAECLRPCLERASQDPHFLSASLGRETPDFALPRFIFLGPLGGGDPIRIGLFAGIHGDEPAGTLALVSLLERCAAQPELVKDFCLYCYPICNPVGFEANTRHARSGRDLNREFWKHSAESEVRYLEGEIATHSFQGIVTLHSDDTSDGLYGFVNGAVLSENLLRPALHAAEAHLPRNYRAEIDGFAARHGIIYECYQGVLRAPPGLHPPPFEVTFETPHHAPMARQIAAIEAAVLTILAEYRTLMATAQNI